MNIIIQIILFFLVGIFIWTLINSHRCLEGYGSFGRVNLGKCCPNGHVFDSKSKKCILICDNCDISSYGKLIMENIGVKISENIFDAYFECSINDSSTIYDYKKINRQYSKKDLLNQNDITPTLKYVEDSWKNISTEIVGPLITGPLITGPLIPYVPINDNSGNSDNSDNSNNSDNSDDSDNSDNSNNSNNSDNS